jgi:ABC-type multidrug transport system fused ATPase/permease subunit
MKAVRAQTTEKMKQNGTLGSFALEQMSAIKLVVAFGREDHAIQKYEKMAQETKETATKAGIKTNYGMNFFITCIVSFQIYCWFIAGLLIEHNWINPMTDKPYEVFDILTVFYSLMFGMFALPGIAPIMPAILKAR